MHSNPREGHRDHEWANFNLHRCSQSAAGNRRSLCPRFRVRRGCHSARGRHRPACRRPRYIASLLAVIIATLISGFGAGLFCLAISVAAVDFFLLLYVELPALLVFILAGLSSVILITGMRFAIERKLLQASKARLQLALDAARLGWWQYDLPGRVVLGDTRFEIEFCGGELMPHPTARWWRRPRSWCRCGLPREVTGSTESEKSHNRVR
jgi:hypothetical protein